MMLAIFITCLLIIYFALKRYFTFLTSIDKLSLISQYLDNQENGIMFLDKKRKIIYANSSFYHMWEIKHCPNIDDIRNNILTKLESANDLLVLLNNVYKNKSVYFGNLNLKNGNIFQAISKPYYHGKKYIGRLWELKDITYRAKEIKKINIASNILDSLEERLPVGFFVKRVKTDNNIEYDYISKGYEKILDHPSSDIKMYSGEEYNKLISEMNVFPSASKKTYEKIYGLNSKASHVKWVFESGVLKRNTKNQEISAEGLVLDITRFKETLSKLYDLNHLLSQSFEQTYLPVIITGHIDKRILFSNKKFNKLLGINSGKSLKGKSVTEVFEKYDIEYINKSGELPKIIPDIDEISNKEALSKEIKIKNVKNKEHWLLVTSSLVNDADNVTYGVITVFNDIGNIKGYENEREKLIKDLRNSIEREKIQSENYLKAFNKLKTAEIKLKGSNNELSSALEKANEANKMKNDFLAILSHEIKTPVSGILGFGELLINDPALNDKHKKFIDYINKSGRRLYNTISDLLELSVIDSGKYDFKPEKVDIEEITNDAILLFKDKISNKGLILDTEIKIKTLISDTSKLRQIIINLVGNAVKYTNEGRINIKIYKEYEYYCISVSDTGIGIKPDDITTIFEMFKRVNDENSYKSEGSGLGLAICKKLAHALGGSIEVKSEYKKGSVFTVKLPVRDVEPEEKLNNMQEDAEFQQKPVILFAEDDDTCMVFIKSVLEQEGYDVKGFYNGRALIEYFNAHKKADIILTDLKMPEDDGFKVLNKLKDAEVNAPVVAITAFALKEEREKALELGFSDYLPKPFTREMLANCIKKNLNDKI